MKNYAESEEGKRRFANPQIYQKSLDYQAEMGKLGVAIHNHYSDECTIDFCCCQGDNLKGVEGLQDTNYHTYIPSFTTSLKQAFSELEAEFSKLVSVPTASKVLLRQKMEEYLKTKY
mgnify:CR=1 FL=1